MEGADGPKIIETGLSNSFTALQNSPLYARLELLEV